jgi:hypothetical protein
MPPRQRPTADPVLRTYVVYSYDTLGPTPHVGRGRGTVVARSRDDARRAARTVNWGVDPDVVRVRSAGSAGSQLLIEALGADGARLRGGREGRGGRRAT